MVRLLPSFNPQSAAIAQHPLYKIEYKQVRWAKTLPTFRTVSLRVVLISALLTIVVWLLLTWIHAQTFPYYNYYISWGSEMFLIVIALSFLVGIVLDFMCMSASADAINSDVANGRWDLLRLTALNEQGILSAKHAISQLRCWRTILVMFGLRLGVSIVGLLLVFVPSLRYANFDAYSVVMLLIIGLMLAVYVLEPFWRARALTALGIYVSSLNRSSSGTFLTAFFALFIVWLLQSAVIGAAMFGVTWIAIGLSTATTAYVYSLVFALCFNGIWLAILCSAIYGFYHLLEQWSLRRTLKRIARSAA